MPELLRNAIKAENSKKENSTDVPKIAKKA
jgi:hypothetical protein